MCGVLFVVWFGFFVFLPRITYFPKAVRNSGEKKKVSEFCNVFKEQVSWMQSIKSWVMVLFCWWYLFSSKL